MDMARQASDARRRQQREPGNRRRTFDEVGNGRTLGTRGRGQEGPELRGPVGTIEQGMHRQHRILCIHRLDGRLGGRPWVGHMSTALRRKRTCWRET